MLAHRGFSHSHWSEYRADLAGYRLMHRRGMSYGHARAYSAQLGWLLDHPTHHNRHWLDHYRGYRHHLEWMLAHRTAMANGWMPAHYSAYETRNAVAA